MKKINLCLILILSVNILFGQKTFTSQEIEEDIAFFYLKLKEVHPEPFSLFSETSFINKTEIAREGIIYPCLTEDFYLMFSPIVSQLSDAHTGVYYYPQHVLLFPLKLKRIGDRFIVYRNFGDNNILKQGVDLVSINNIPTVEIIDKLCAFESGESKSLKEDFLLNRDFPYLLYTVYKFKDNFKLEIKNKQNSIHQQINVKGISSDVYELKDSQITKHAFQLLLKKNIAIFTINSFEYEYLEEFKAFLKESFLKIKQNSISNLIIDIRQNDGGSSSLGDLLLKYISDKAFCQESKEILKISEAYKLQNDKTNKDKLGSLRTRITGLNNLIKPYPYNKRFHGQVYVLIGKHTFSAGSEFSAAMKDYNLAVFIGEETGGRASSFGEMLGFFLPNTRLRFGISCKKFIRPSQLDDGKGVLPDYSIVPTYDDFFYNRDRVLNFTENLINNSAL